MPIVAHYREMNSDKQNSAIHGFSPFAVRAAGFWPPLRPAFRGGQQTDLQHANNFTSAEYYGPTNQQQVKSILSGAEALPQPGGLLIIKQLKLEMFNPDGKLECGGERAGVRL